MLSIVCDNASVNDSMIEAVGEQEWKRFYSDKGRVRCFAHVLNLISGVSLNAFETFERLNVY